MRSSRKAQGGNYISAIVYIFAFVIISIIGYKIYDATIEGFDDAGYLDNEDSQKAVKGFTRAMNLFDIVTLFVLVAMIIGSGISSYYINTKPVFFIITFISAIVYGLISYIFNYVFIEMVSNSTFDSVVSHFPISILICKNLHWVMLALIVIGSITLYGKRED